jgi:GDPmannose 4,6-dehydratase
MWLMLQQDTADDYVIGTGESHTIREFVELAFALVDLDWKDFVDIDPVYYRPAEVDFLCADSSKARHVIGWEPSVSFSDLVRIMVDADMAALSSGRERVLYRTAV